MRKLKTENFQFTANISIQCVNVLFHSWVIFSQKAHNTNNNAWNLEKSNLWKFKSYDQY